jgi:crotonobetainyl-CoA:carnitine CoA-transferase CaiB-like acyl-CoA transferase
MGPLATQILGDLGAEVITVETPGLSLNRAMTPGPHPGMSGLALNLLRNKHSIIIDLSVDDGRRLAMRIAATCDVFISNLRPSSLDRLGLDFSSLVEQRPDIVYCQAQGFPSESSYADDPAYDDVIQAAAGIADLGERVDGRPALVPTILADKVSGMVIAQMVLAGLLRRERTGEGAQIEVPMSEVVTSFVLVEHAAAATAIPAQGPPGYARILTPHRRPAATKDGWVHVLPYNRRNYLDLFEAGGRFDMFEDPRIGSVQNRLQYSDALYAEVAKILLGRTTKDWLKFCRDHEIPASPVRTLDELINEQPLAEHPRTGPYRATRPFGRLIGSESTTVRHHAPMQGEDTRTILTNVGLASAEIDRLIEEKTVRTEPQERVRRRKPDLEQNPL